MPSPPPPTDGNTDPLGLPAYANNYNIVADYEVDTGVLVLPTCDGGGPVAIQVSDPYRVKKVAYDGRGFGRPPVMPRPADADTVISHTHAQRLPGLTASGLGAFVYDCRGGYMVLESGLAAAFSEAEYECPRYPAKFPALSVEMEAAGFKWLPNQPHASGSSSVDLTNPAYQWPQALTVTSHFFSDLIL